ncbi:Hypothetical predicted protein [Octopus vulgaris]|uniref:Uncharacterized protein n=1 Tax=Octopus vulgaris TaxID=6645 RepID=A0AA36F499_OCTVU|nr:Hypothetical predicted protein [Octopus vulgaris]
MVRGKKPPPDPSFLTVHKYICNTTGSRSSQMKRITDVKNTRRRAKCGKGPFKRDLMQDRKIDKCRSRDILHE